MDAHCTFARGSGTTTIPYTAAGYFRYLPVCMIRVLSHTAITYLPRFCLANAPRARFATHATTISFFSGSYAFMNAVAARAWLPTTAYHHTSPPPPRNSRTSPHTTPKTLRADGNVALLLIR